MTAEKGPRETKKKRNKTEEAERGFNKKIKPRKTKKEGADRESERERRMKRNRKIRKGNKKKNQEEGLG